jgi:hypothetical protein
MLDAPGLSAAIALPPSPSRRAAAKPIVRFIRALHLGSPKKTEAAYDCSGWPGNQTPSRSLVCRVKLGTWERGKYETVVTCSVPRRCVDCAGERDAGRKTERSWRQQRHGARPRPWSSLRLGKGTRSSLRLAARSPSWLVALRTSLPLNQMA